LKPQNKLYISIAPAHAVFHVCVFPFASNLSAGLERASICHGNACKLRVIQQQVKPCTSIATAHAFVCSFAANLQAGMEYSSFKHGVETLPGINEDNSGQWVSISSSSPTRC